MVQIKNKTISDYKRGEITLNDVAQQLLAKYPVIELAEALAELLLEGNKPASSQPTKIAVTAEEMEVIQNLFRIKQTGTGRGRKPKTDK